MTNPLQATPRYITRKKVISENCNERRQSHTKLCKLHTQFFLKQGKSLVRQDNDLLETSLITILRQFPQTNLQTGDNKEP